MPSSSFDVPMESMAKPSQKLPGSQGQVIKVESSSGSRSIKQRLQDAKESLLGRKRKWKLPVA
ncbi:hypothetical protein RvY_05821 [Ramazzottius varieornatus]|uniref:Uncharacterized protein n=1 Tax=Ramazzottius varieornatus TaxID=947166 RepID=A0A1D1UWV6_RAMVA|nr:hypothetical protein RvY_05821 [Ramazzottius varieornatus]